MVHWFRYVNYNQTSSVLVSLTAQFKRMYKSKILVLFVCLVEELTIMWDWWWRSTNLREQDDFFPKKEIQTRLDAFSFWARLNASKYMVKHLMRPNASIKRIQTRLWNASRRGRCFILPAFKRVPLLAFQTRLKRVFRCV